MQIIINLKLKINNNQLLWYIYFRSIYMSKIT